MSVLQFDESIEPLRPFLAALVNRLAKGEQVFRGKSLERSPDELLAELQEEALDLAGWGAILFEKIRRMRERLAEGTSDTPGLALSNETGGGARGAQR